MMLSHDSLQNHMKTNFALMHHHKWSLAEINDLLPWERSIYIDLLQDYLKSMAEQHRDEKAQKEAVLRRMK